MKRLIILLILFGIAIVSVWFFAFRPFREEPEDTFTIDPSLLTELTPGFSYALSSPLWVMRGVHIGDEILFNLFVEYDRTRFQIDPQSFRNSPITPFSMRSFSYRTRSTSPNFELAFFTMKVQCVTCAPGKTHRLEALRLQYLDLASPEKPEELVMIPALEVPYLFNTEEFRIRPIEREVFEPHTFNEQFIFGGGVLVMAIGLGFIGYFWPKQKKGGTLAVLSSRQRFSLRVAALKKEDFSSRDTRKTVFHEMYEAVSQFVFQEYGCDIMQRGADFSPVPYNLHAFIDGLKNGYTRNGVTESDLACAFEQLDEFFRMDVPTS